MSNPFEVGDVVKCVKSTKYLSIKEGEQYIVTRVNNEFVYIDNAHDAHDGGFYPSRFKLIKKGSTNPTFIVTFPKQDNHLLIETVKTMLTSSGYSYTRGDPAKLHSTVCFYVDTAHKQYDVIGDSAIKYYFAYDASKDLHALIERLTIKTKTKQVRLNDNITATVTLENITIDGYKTIPIKAIKELQDAWLSVTSLSNNELSIKVPTDKPAVHRAIQQLLFGYDIVWASESTSRKHILRDAGCRLVVYRGSNSTYFAYDDVKHLFDIDAVTEFPKLISKLDDFVSKPVEANVVLNSQLTALVKRDEIRVGCQTFKCEVIAQLKAAVNELSKTE
jgi:hypothetical protein